MPESISYPTTLIDFSLLDGSQIKIESNVTGKENVSLKLYPIEEICQTIGSISKALSTGFKSSEASKATVKFGVDISIESGQLTTLIVKGSTKGSLEITLEWNKPSVHANPTT